mmetsp:Transcript_15729/g.24173  ORF Transcript_15729/g.24173 Transcript_15729/m.24173 type:complete len:130 (-) Transcript_15729:30-419(-)
MTVETLLALFNYNFKADKTMWFICIQLNYLVVAGIFALFPTPAYKTFGQDKAPQIYSLILLGSFFSSASDNVLIKVVYPYIGALNIFFIGAGASIVSLFILLFFNERLDIERMDAKGLIVWGPPKERKG